MITVDYHDDLKEVQADPALAALLNAPQASAPFDRLAWWQGLADYCEMVPLIAVARSGDQRAVLPLHRRGARIQCLANWYTFRAAPLFSASADRPALLRALASSLAGQTSHLVLAPLSDDHGDVSALVAALRGAGWMTFIEPYDVNHALRVDRRSFDLYLEDRPGPLRTILRRKTEKVAVTIETAFNPDSWAAYEDIYAGSWKGEEGYPGFLKAFAEQEGAAGRLRLALARADGQAIAAQFWTVEGGTAFIHKLAHHEAAKALSPGSTLIAALLKHVIDVDAVQWVDFGTGDDAFKRDWMEQVRPRYRIEAFRAYRPATWPAIARKTLHRLAGARAHG